MQGASVHALGGGPGQHPALATQRPETTEAGDDWRFRIEVIGLGEQVQRVRYPKLLQVPAKPHRGTRAAYV
jgi:hypothetical protein